MNSTNVYWEFALYDGGWMADVWSVGIDGGVPVRVTTSSTPSQGLAGPLALDDGGVYFLASAGPTTPGSVQKVDFATGAQTTVASVSSGILDGDDIVVANGEVYFTEVWTNSVFGVAASGGTPAKVASAEDTYLLAFDSTNLYWATYSGAISGNTTPGEVFELPLSGGPPVGLASLPPQPTANAYVNGLAAGGGAVVWTAGGDDGGVVGTWSLGAGAQRSLATGLSNPAAIAVDSCSAYWLNYQGTASLMKVPLGGGTPITMLDTLSYPTGLAVDATSVYVVDYGVGQILKVTPK